MTIRLTLIAALAAAGFAGSANAALIETNSAHWTSDVAPSMTLVGTTSNGGTLYDSNVTSYHLNGGVGTNVGFSSATTLLAPWSGWGPWSAGYGGDILDTQGQSITLSFSKPVAMFGLEVSPDMPIFGSFAETFTVALSDGTTRTISGSYNDFTNPTQFVGFYDGSISWMTITAKNAPDFAFGNFSIAVPEPATMLLLGAGMLGLGAIRRRSAR